MKRIVFVLVVLMALSGCVGANPQSIVVKPIDTVLLSLKDNITPDHVTISRYYPGAVADSEDRAEMRMTVHLGDNTTTKKWQATTDPNETELQFTLATPIYGNIKSIRRIESGYMVHNAKGQEIDAVKVLHGAYGENLLSYGLTDSDLKKDPMMQLKLMGVPQADIDKAVLVKDETPYAVNLEQGNTILIVGGFTPSASRVTTIEYSSKAVIALNYITPDVAPTKEKEISYGYAYSGQYGQYYPAPKDAQNWVTIDGQYPVNVSYTLAPFESRVVFVKLAMPKGAITLHDKWAFQIAAAKTSGKISTEMRTWYFVEMK